MRPCRTPPTKVSSSASNRMRRAAPVAEAPAAQLIADVVDGDREPCGEPLDDHDERAPM